MTKLIPGKLYNFNGIDSGWSLGVNNQEDIDYYYKIADLMFIKRIERMEINHVSKYKVNRYYFLCGKQQAYRNVSATETAAFESCFKEII